MRESDEGAWVRFADHEKALNQDVPIAYEKKLQQFDRLRRYAYQVLAEAHQVLWGVDRIPELGEMVEKEAAKNNLMTWQLSQEQYDALVRDAMNWRSAMNPADDRKEPPKPESLMPGFGAAIEERDKLRNALMTALHYMRNAGANIERDFTEIAEAESLVVRNQRKPQPINP